MNWLASIAVGICSAPLTGLICGVAAAACADWLRVPQREGAAGFFAVGMALVGAFAGLVLGIAFARGWASAEPTFAKAFGMTLATCAALSLVISVIAWLAADLDPKIDGRELELALELRCPPGTSLDFGEQQAWPPYATFIRLSDGKSRGHATLDVKAAREVEGRYIVPATLRLRTSAKRKLLNVRLDDERNLMFAVGFGSKPSKSDFAWSRWIDAGYKMGEAPPPPERTFAVRYQARFVEPSPRAQTLEEQGAAAEAQQK